MVSEGPVWVLVRVWQKILFQIDTFCSCHIVNELKVYFIHRLPCVDVWFGNYLTSVLDLFPESSCID